MDSPQNNIWGPHLWTILHSAAEKIGLPQHKRLPQEEMRLWTNLFTSLRYSLPCPLCKKHFTSYHSANPIQTFTRDSIRIWLYNLHNDINIRLGKENIITIDKIPEIYNNPINFNHHLNIINNQMTYSLRLGWCSREDIQRTLRFFQEVRRFYDFF
jgi:hypothetical protein